MKRILITGSREWRRPDVIATEIQKWVIDNCPKPEDIVVVHGDASRGADRMARDICRQADWITEEAHPADWNAHGKAAGFIRNQEMVNLGADVLLAFIRNNSKGATHTVKCAREAGIPVLIVRDDDPIDEGAAVA